MVTKVTSSNFSSSITQILTAAGSLPTISNVQVTDSSYTTTGVNVLDPAAVSYIKITGTNFSAGSQVFIESSPATTVTFVSSTQLNVVLPSKSSGTYIIYVVNTDGSVAIRINAVTYSTSPVWSTASSLQENSTGTPVSIQLAATSDSNILYTVTGGALPDGLTLSTGGLLSGVVTGLTSTTTYNFTVTATDVENQANNRSFSITISASDPYWKYTSLLLRGKTSTTTFINDDSTNNLLLTINGDVRADTFNPYQSGYYSMYNNGADATATIGSGSTLFNLSGDFTVEAWVFPTTQLASDWGIIDARTAGQSATPWLMNLSTSTTYKIGFYGGQYNNGATTVPLNTWTHICYTRSGSVLRGFFNGKLDYYNGSYGTGALSPGSTVPVIGTKDTGLAGYDSPGYISNLRLVNGSVVYSTASTTIGTQVFTPSTTPLTAVANTTLLTCQSNRHVDNSVNNFTITPSDYTKITVRPAHPFTPNSNYATYGSAYFDGTGDYLSTVQGTQFAFGTGDYTIEAWVYRTDSGTQRAIIDLRGGGYVNVLFYMNSANQLVAFNSTSSWIVSTGTIPLNQWAHVALTRSGTSAKLFINGVVDGTATNSDNNVSSGPPYIGRQFGSTTNDWLGYIQDVRVIKGTALYTANFSLPQTLLTNVTNTQLLTLQYNSNANNNGFSDRSGFDNIITRYGNATQGTFSPYSQNGWSNYFPGSGNYITTPATHDIFAAGSQDFTVECWIKLTSTPGTHSMVCGWNASPWDYFEVNNLGFNLNTNNVYTIGANFTWTIGTWYHLAISRISNTAYCFVNGILIGSGISNSSSFGVSSAALRIGDWCTTPSYPFPGFISNFRFIKGAGLYSTSFTPSTTPLTPTSNTRLLTCQSNRFVDNGPNNYALTLTGAPTVQAYSPFGSVTSLPTSYSTYFDGTGDYAAGSASVPITTGTFTVEFWINVPSLGATRAILDNSYWNTGDNGGWNVYLNSDNTISLNSSPVNVYNTTINIIKTTSTISANTWTHVAIVRNASDQVNVYFNGVVAATPVTYSTTLNTGYGGWTGLVFRLGYHLADGGVYDVFYGYISNARVVQGTAVYTSAFTPPTSPLTAIANTILLTCQSSTLIDNGPNKVTFTTTGDCRPLPFNPFGLTNTLNVSYAPETNSGSVYYDGTGDYISSPTNPMFAFGASNDFTAECWAYFTTVNASSSPGLMSVANSGSSTGWQVYYDSNNGWGVRSNAVNVFTNANPPKPNQWYHVAYVRKSGTHRLYVNGVLAVSTSGTAMTYSDQVFYSGYTPIGQTVYGYVSDIRIFNGVALYTNNFYPPSSPLTSSVTIGSTTYNAVMLLNFTDAGIIDYHSSASFETSNTQLSPSNKKFSTSSSMYFNGTNSYMVKPMSPLYQFSSSDWTVEFWIYYTALPSAQTWLLGAGPNGSGGVARGWGIRLHDGTSGGLTFQYQSSNLINNFGSLPTANAWHHVAFTRNGTSIKCFVDGAQLGSTWTISTTTFTDALMTEFFGIGGYDNSNNGLPGRYWFNGYLEDLRITTGYSRYNSGFTVPSLSLAK